MNIRRITLHLVRMKLKSAFTTSYGSYLDREAILVEMEDGDGHTGWGEGAAFSTPWYTEETVETSWHMIRDFLAPALLRQPVDHPEQIPSRFAQVRRNPMAKAALETAAWDLYARREGLSLSRVLGGVRSDIESGVAVGLQPSPNELYRTLEAYLVEGYKRVKVKIKPGSDVDLLRGIRSRFPDVPLMADANSAYSLQDADHLKRLDEFNLLLLEQPLGEDDIVDHAKLQQLIRTPVCLDESIVTYEDARNALELDSCRIINLKIGRVGGLTEARRIHDLCAARGVPVWCGGMLETGVGRAHNIALASLPNFTIPGDISASSRYWERDVIVPEVVVRDGKIRVPDAPGIGFEMDREFMESVTVRRESFQV
jgi:O-succinylbenzoate synthase